MDGNVDRPTRWLAMSDEAGVAVMETSWSFFFL